MSSIRAPAAKKTTTLTVAVKCRPLMEKERGSRDIVRVNNSKEVIVLDPDLSKEKDYLDQIQNRTKKKKYCFDHAFGPESTNKNVYRSMSSVISGVVHGLNATVVAYGSIGSGKTYTMVGTPSDPGLMVLSLNTVFDMIKSDKSADEFEVTCSYLEVYNEVIYDLLEKSSGHLELREDPEQGIVVVGLQSIKVYSADQILELLNLGNSRRKTESTEMNGTSSRSHAVLEIAVKRRQKNPNQVMRGKLALVDLAGSEKAAETNNGGQKLRDGANISRSLLALANCINALGKQKKGVAHVPYRNSKLTRILKDGLSGNSQTVMVATISPADSQYHHTVNTLKYADRAKEIKTHIQSEAGGDKGDSLKVLMIEKLEDAKEAGGENSHLCTLILTEGDSSKALAMSGLPITAKKRDYYGIYPIIGKILNVRKASEAKIRKNKVVQDIIKILNLNREMEYTDSRSLRYGQVMIMTDQDDDGTHMTGLIINLFSTLCPSLLKIPSFLVEFVTPIVKASHKSKDPITFNSLHDYLKWNKDEKGNASEWSIKYYKGLGSSTGQEGMMYFDDIDSHLREFVWSDGDGDAIEVAFGKDQEKRKEWIQKYIRVSKVELRKPKITFKEFVDEELVSFAKTDLRRSIPAMIDGLKSGERKILYTAFKIGLTELIPVKDLSSLVSQHAAYHHSEKCISQVIIRMAQDFVGRNNVNLFDPSGQFGTRASGGNDAASERYLYTKLREVTRVLFPQDDDALLRYQYEYGQTIEPERYAPLIPLVLLNGAKGIGTGYSSFIPQFNPKEVVANVRRCIKGEKMEAMIPWYKGFEGTIEKTEEVGDKGECIYTTYGKCHDDDKGGTVQISELPIGLWTDGCKRFLLSLKATNGDPFIQDVNVYNDGSSVSLVLRLSEENKQAARQEGYEKKFKLETKIATTNMNLVIDEDQIKKYHTPEEIIEDFVPQRIDFYHKRRDHMEKSVKNEVTELESQLKFVRGVHNGDIQVINRWKGDIVKDLGETAVDAEKLLKLSLTRDQCTELEKELEKKHAELRYWSSTSSSSMYEEDLKKFENLLYGSEASSSRKRVTPSIPCPREVRPKRSH